MAGRLPRDTPMDPIPCNSTYPGSCSPCETYLTSGQAIGLAFSTQSGVLSFASVLVLFGIMAVKYRQASPARRRGLWTSYIDVYMLNLFVSELLMAFGGMMDGKWANEAHAYCGQYCNAQGSLQFIGETSVSLWTLIVTLHTCWCVIRARHPIFQPVICYGAVLAVWVYVFVFNFVAFTATDQYFVPTPFWCWINRTYQGQRLGEYIWLWVAGVGNIVVYIPLYFFLRQQAAQPDNASTNSHLDRALEVRREASKFLWYPFAYTILVLPLSVARWTNYSRPVQENYPRTMTGSLATAQLIFHALYRLSGVVNVVLLFTTKPDVLLLGGEDQVVQDEEGDHNQYVRDTYSDAHEMRRRPNGHSGGTAGFGGPQVKFTRDEE